MPVTVTGGKYAVASLSAVNTRSLAVSTAPFVSGDFSIQRIVGLWNSAGTNFKGFAYVRKFLSTSSLELNAPFIDPATGLEVTQVVGDTVLVSKNFAESVAAGLAVSGSTVTLTDSLILGTAGQSQSLCFYDEAKVINSSVGGTTLAIQAAGGLSALGQLQSYADRRTGKSCGISFNGASPYGVVMTNAAAIWCMFGGSIEGTGGSWNGGYGGTSPNLQLWMNVVSGREFISPGAGGNWTNPTRQILANCSAIGGGIVVRWGNGSILGGAFRMPVFATPPFAMFGSDTAGTYSIGSPSGTRLTANLDGKASGTTGVPALWRSSLATVQTINFTNVLYYDRRAISGSGANHTSATQNFYFSDTYTNLVAETVGVVLNNIGIAASAASVAGSWAPSLLHEVWNGVNKTTTYGPWTFGFKAYGYRAASGAFSAAPFQLEGTLTADNVAFGGLVNQTLLEPPVTLSKAAALALSTIVTLDDLFDASMAWSVASVTNAQYPTLGTYPINASGALLNLGELNLVIDPAAASAFSINTGASVVTIKATTLVAGSKFSALTTTGTVTLSGAGTVSGLQIVGDVIQATPGNLNGVTITGDLTYNEPTSLTVALTNTTVTGTVSNTGAGVVSVSPVGSTSLGTAGTNVVFLTVPKSVSITGVTAGSRLQIYNVTTAAEVVNTVVSGTSYSATYTEGAEYSVDDVVRVRLAHDSGATARLPFTGQAIVGATGWALLASQQDDSVYNALAIDGSAVTEFTADYPNIQIDINDPDGSTRVERLYAWFVHAQSSTEGIRQWFGGIVPEDEANFRVVTALLDLKIDNAASTGVTFTDGRRLYRDDNASPLVSSTSGGGSITFFAGKVYTSVVSTASPVITGDIADVGPAVRTSLLGDLTDIQTSADKAVANAALAAALSA